MNMPNVVDDRRRALDGLAAQLKTKVIDVVNAAWTSQVSGAAKSVTDVWPDTLTADQTKLQQAFAAYRPQVEVEPPITPRDAAVKAVTDAADQYGKDLAATSSALVGAKTYKSDSEKSTIDAARDAMDKAAVALTGWKGDFLRFDASVVAQPVPPPTPTPPTPTPPTPPTPTPPTQPQISFATIVNGNPFPVTIRTTISDPADWASTTNRPDVALGSVSLDDFGQVRVRLDMAGNASKATYRVEATLQANPTTVISFTVDQKSVSKAQNYVPIATQPPSTDYLVYVVTQPDMLELGVVVAEQEKE